MQFLRDFYRSLTLKPQGFTIVLAAFLPVFAIIAMFPVVAAIIAHFHDDPDAPILVPQMVTAPGYAIALLAPFAGLFVDRFGRRPLLLVCTFFYGALGAAPYLLDSLRAIIGTRIVLGVCEAGILTIVNTLIADYWDDNGRRNWLMLQGMIGPALQPLVFILVSAVAAIQWNAGFLVYLVAFPIFFAMYFTLFEPERAASPLAGDARDGGNGSDGQASGSRFPAGEAALVAGLTLFVSILYYVFIVNGSIAWQEIGLADPMAVSKATAIPALFILLGAVLFRFVSRWSNAIQISTFLVILGLGLAGIGVAHDVRTMQFALAVQQTGAGMAIPALIAWAQSKFSFEHRGRGMGVWTSAFFLGQAISPVVVGTVAARAGSMHAAFTLAGLTALVGGALLLMVSRRTAAI
ncbi:MFS transporter [Novosphingobium huizhouense]|uniref:MFS transporter n=1 Tax=Novosphingobium huizhouense TaxID=2866625 RepID=UPI001CD8FCCD|nr:MFS transporter [Novosphingobium huizhouense]